MLHRKVNNYECGLYDHGEVYIQTEPQQLLANQGKVYLTVRELRHLLALTKERHVYPPRKLFWRVYHHCKEWLHAFRDGPTWPFCQVCRWRPLSADDVGWWCIYPEMWKVGEPPTPGKLVCFHCLMHSAEGKRHFEIHGVGER